MLASIIKMIICVCIVIITYILMSWNNGMRCIFFYSITTLQWRHNGRDSVSNHQPHDCLLNCLFRRRSKKTLKLRLFVRGIHRGPVNSSHKWPVTRNMFPFDDVIMILFLVSLSYVVINSFSYWMVPNEFKIYVFKLYMIIRLFLVEVVVIRSLAILNAAYR